MNFKPLLERFKEIFFWNLYGMKENIKINEINVNLNVYYSLVRLQTNLLIQ